MNRNSVYEVRLGKVICGGNRNINSYYLLLRNDKLPAKLISKAMRIDEDNQDELCSEVEIKPNTVEIWNYDKMRLVDRYKIDFKVQAKFTWTIYEENMEVSVERFNEWEEEMKRRKEGEELEPSSMRESERTQQRSEATSSKIASSSPSKAVKTPSQKKSEPVSQLLPPPNPRRINDSIAKLTPQS